MSQPPKLGQFFEQMRAYLRGHRTAQETAAALGPSPSGAESFGFYRVLITRNHRNFMRSLFGTLAALVERTTPGAWQPLCEDYERQRTATHWHPSSYGAEFPEFLAKRREAATDQPVDQPAVWEEIADLCVIRQQCRMCPRELGDGFERRLFVRQYTFPVPELMHRLAKEPQCELPVAKPTVVLVYRHAIDLSQREFYPSAAGLGALARRQGLGQLPDMFSTIPTALIDTAESLLVEHGILLAPQPQPQP